MGKKRGKKQNFIKFSTKVSGFERGEKAKVFYKGTALRLSDTNSLSH